MGVGKKEKMKSTEYFGANKNKHMKIENWVEKNVFFRRKFPITFTCYKLERRKKKLTEQTLVKEIMEAVSTRNYHYFSITLGV